MQRKESLLHWGKHALFLTPRILDLNLALGRGWEETHASEGKETEAAFPARTMASNPRLKEAS